MHAEIKQYQQFLEEPEIYDQDTKEITMAFALAVYNREVGDDIEDNLRLSVDALLAIDRDNLTKGGQFTDTRHYLQAISRVLRTGQSVKDNWHTVYEYDTWLHKVEDLYVKYSKMLPMR